MFYRRFFIAKKIKLVLKLSVIEIYQLKSYCFLSVPSAIPPSLGGGWIAQITGLRQ
jgi:hypothetical protein